MRRMPLRLHRRCVLRADSPPLRMHHLYHLPKLRRRQTSSRKWPVSRPAPCQRQRGRNRPHQTRSLCLQKRLLPVLPSMQTTTRLRPCREDLPCRWLAAPVRRPPVPAFR
jgi:hypothetical protein